MNILIPNDVNFIIKELTKNAYEAYVVGGSIRDSLMGKTPSDWDICTDAMSDDVTKIFSAFGLRTISTGKLFGTTTVLIHNQPYEITTYRIESDYRNYRKPANVTFSSSIEDDLRRRDFTINAMAYSTESGLIDLFDGLDDINDKIIRAVGEPEERFREDALRILRAIRFASQLGFDIHPKTAEAMDKHKGLVVHLSRERIRSELDKIIMSDRPTLGLQLLDKFEIIRLIKPIKIKLPANLDLVKKNLVHRLALLAIVNIYTQGISSDSLAQRLNSLEKALKGLRYDGNTSKYVLSLVKEYHSLQNLPNEMSFKKLIGEIGNDKVSELLLVLKEAKDIPWNNANMKLRDLEILFKKIIDGKQPVALKDLKISGDIVKALGITEGKEVGFILSYLLDMVLEKPELNEHDTLLEMTLKYLKSRQ